MDNHFVQRVHQFICQRHLVDSGEKVLVGVSGGADSLALLYVLHALRSPLNCDLHIAHLDHALRPTSAQDAAFVEAHAKKLGVPVSVDRVDVAMIAKQEKLSIEMAARSARYHFFATVAAQTSATKIAIGHHRGDQAETVLMNLLRGSGMAGLKGMCPVRDGCIIRPLLACSRREIEQYVTELGLKPCQDETNRLLDYQRNRIRHTLIPHLEKTYNPNLQATLSQTAEVLREESALLDALTEEAFKACQLPTEARSGGGPPVIVFDRKRFLAHHVALQRRMLRFAFARLLADQDRPIAEDRDRSSEMAVGQSACGNLPSPFRRGAGGEVNINFYHIAEAIRLIEAGRPNAAVYLPGGWEVRRAYDRVYLRQTAETSQAFCYEIAVPGHTDLPLLDAEIVASVIEKPTPPFPDGKYEAIFDLDSLSSPLILRNRRPGDRFQPFGMKGSKKVKDVFIDAKVPTQERERIPLVVSGDEVVWIVGYRVSEQHKVCPGTKRGLRLTYLRKDDAHPHPTLR